MQVLSTHILSSRSIFVFVLGIRFIVRRQVSLSVNFPVGVPVAQY